MSHCWLRDAAPCLIYLLPGELRGSDHGYAGHN
jgi:hypothetical protein